MAAVTQWFAAMPLLLLGALVSPREISATNILCILTTPTRSHHIWSAPLVKALATRGYNVTVLSPTAMSPPVPGVTDLVIEGSLAFTAANNMNHTYRDFSNLDMLLWLNYGYEWYLSSCNYTLSTNGVRQLNEYPDDFRFDLIIIEATGGECLLGLVEKFGRPPLVAINGFGNPHWLNWNAGNPDHPAYIPNFMFTLQWPFTFAERLLNVACYMATLNGYYSYYLPESDRQLKGFFGSKSWISRVPPVQETLKNISLVLVNAHYSLDGARPMVPGIIPVAGIHIQPPKPLPKDLQQWLDGASEEHGAVLFSLGSLVRSDQMSVRQRDALVAAFAALPKVRFLWKWESDTPPPNLPPNVRIGKWLPQNDILAHPKVRVFLSHSGLLSTHEATWRGVPVVAMPFIVDQHLNARRLRALGVAEVLTYSALTKEAVLDALLKVLQDPSYRTRMLQLSSLFRSRPELPMDTALFWIEHVLRHRGAPRMRCPAVDIAWYDMLLLDVAAVVIGVVSVGALVAFCSLRVVRRLIRRKQKIE